MLIYAWASTDVGQKRLKNEDNYLIAPELQLLAVADGMGGHRAGAVASSIAVEAIDRTVRAARAHPSSVRAHTAFDSAALLRGSLLQANADIQARGNADPDLRGMGTTTTSLLFDGDRAIIAHVGDSRVYRVRGERIEQLSEDHSVVAQQVKAGLITPEQAKHSPYKNVIMRSVGVEPELDVDVGIVEVKNGDAFLLCSDGLSNVVSDEEMLGCVAENFLHRVPDLLIDLANERGGPDNITVVVAYAVDERAGAAALP